METSPVFPIDIDISKNNGGQTGLKRLIEVSSIDSYSERFCFHVFGDF